MLPPGGDKSRCIPNSRVTQSCPERRHHHISVSHSVVSNSLRPEGLQPARLFCLWDFPDKNTGVGSHFLLQGIFPTQGSNLGLLHCRQILYCLSHQGSLMIINSDCWIRSQGWSLGNIHYYDHFLRFRIHLQEQN